MSNKLILREYYELCEGGVCEDHLTEAEKKEVRGGALYLSGVMHNTYVGVGGMLIQDMLVWLWYLASVQREERVEQGDKIIDTLGFWPGSRMRIYKAWAKKASTVMEEE